MIDGREHTAGQAAVYRGVIRTALLDNVSLIKEHQSMSKNEADVGMATIRVIQRSFHIIKQGHHGCLWLAPVKDCIMWLKCGLLSSFSVQLYSHSSIKDSRYFQEPDEKNDTTLISAS